MFSPNHRLQVQIDENQEFLNMSVELLDGTTILGFIEDERAFHTTIEARFSLDSDSDGRLTYAEMAKELMSLRVLGSSMPPKWEPSLSHEEAVRLYQGLFKQFDKDGDGTVDLEEFRAEMKEVMLAEVRAYRRFGLFVIGGYFL
jgi:Ca2+-binding EF-hand superfamily protein